MSAPLNGYFGSRRDPLHHRQLRRGPRQGSATASAAGCGPVLIRARAARFADEWKNAHYERGESLIFYNELFEVFGVTRRRVASFEEPVKKLGNERGFIDLFWKGDRDRAAHLFGLYEKLVAPLVAAASQPTRRPSKRTTLVTMADESKSETSSQRKALRLLKSIYDQTRGQTQPVFVVELVPSIGLTEEDSQAAWRYLKDKGLIDTFNILYTARINAAGVDAIENAQRQPDDSTANFPAVSYIRAGGSISAGGSITVNNNTVHVGSAANSPIQQAGAHSVQAQTTTCSEQDRSDLTRLVNDLAAHLDELQLDARQQQKAKAQVATLYAQLSDEPDPVIVKQAGRVLRNITESAIASVIATATTQPAMWTWVQAHMAMLFG